MRTAVQRNALIAASALGLVMVVGPLLERREAARTAPGDELSKRTAVQLRSLEGATKGSGAPRSAPPTPTAVPAPGADSTAAKPVVIDVVKPWIEIARMPKYVQANYAERRAVRDLYWHECVEERIPIEQGTSAYWQFVRNWDTRESGPSDSQRTTSPQQYLREKRVTSPVDAGTMRRWCHP